MTQSLHTQNSFFLTFSAQAILMRCIVDQRSSSWGRGGTGGMYTAPAPPYEATTPPRYQTTTVLNPKPLPRLTFAINIVLLM